MICKLSGLLLAVTLFITGVHAMPVDIYERSLQQSGGELDARDYIDFDDLNARALEERTFEDPEEYFFVRSEDGYPVYISREDAEMFDARGFGGLFSMVSKVVGAGSKVAHSEHAAHALKSGMKAVEKVDHATNQVAEVQQNVHNIHSTAQQIHQSHEEHKQERAARKEQKREAKRQKKLEKEQRKHQNH